MSILVTQDTGGADIVRDKQLFELVLVHRLRKVGHVEIGITFVLEGLELRVEGLLQ